MFSYISFILLSAAFAFAPRFSLGLREGLVIAASVVFVGFRYEMAFDWPFYVDLYEDLRFLTLGQFLQSFGAIQLQYPVETGFLLFNFLGAKFLPDYEWFQALIFLIFLGGLWSLGRASRCKNIGAALVLIHLFLLFTLEFSTLRQALAIGLFNLGLAAHLRGKIKLTIAFFSLAVLSQISVLIYIAAFMMVLGAPRRLWLLVVGVTIFAVPLSMPSIVLQFAGLLPSFAASKLNYYFNDRVYGANLLEITFSVVMYLTVVFCAVFAERRLPQDTRKETHFLLRFVVVLSLLALPFIFFNTFRNRILYELVVVFSVVAFSGLRGGAFRMVVPFGAFGIMMFVAAAIRPTNFTYIPYQNYFIHSAMGWESDGLERLDRLRWFLKSR